MSTPTPVEFHIPKGNWDYGPWHHEPDREDFEYAGFACLVVRNHWGALCGYCAVDRSHPLYGVKYSDVDIDAHGGLTYSDRCSGPVCHVPKPGMPDDVWWFGFDCGHFMDLMPGMIAFEKMLRFDTDHSLYRPSEKYRNLRYVKAQIRHMARQLAVLAVPADQHGTDPRTDVPAPDPHTKTTAS